MTSKDKPLLQMVTSQITLYLRVKKFLIRTLVMVKVQLNAMLIQTQLKMKARKTLKNAQMIKIHRAKKMNLARNFHRLIKRKHWCLKI